jgi:hypothetical protein
VTGQVTVRGADQFARTLGQFGDDLTHLDAAHAAAGDRVIAATRPRTRRKSGRLAASWTTRVTADGAEVGSPVVYAGVQERGWPARHITPSRALGGGLDAATPGIEQVYFQAIDKAMGQVRGA